jgi:hypothetical protein
LTQSKNIALTSELMRQLGVRYPTEGLIKHEIVWAMRLTEAEPQLTGRVEVENVHFGGERSTGWTGHCSGDKIFFVAAV